MHEKCWSDGHEKDTHVNISSTLSGLPLLQCKPAAFSSNFDALSHIGCFLQKTRLYHVKLSKRVNRYWITFWINFQLFMQKIFSFYIFDIKPKAKISKHYWQIHDLRTYHTALSKGYIFIHTHTKNNCNCDLYCISSNYTYVHTWEKILV